MERMEELKQQLESLRPEEWDKIPDIDLYMDQVIAYMKRQHIGLALGDEEQLTSAMINNYVKSGLLPRAKGKKYNREHIGYLTAICLLKQVVSVGEAGVLLSRQMVHQDIRTFYESYTGILDEAYSELAGKIDPDAGEEALEELALQLAVESYARKLACKTIIGILAEGKGKE